MKRIEVNIPEWALTYLEYGEVSDISEEDINCVEEWLNAIAKEGFTNPVFQYYLEDSEGFFSSCPEFGLPCQCIKCMVTQFE